MGGLSLLAPKGLWLLGLLAPLVVLYILKIRRQRRRVASTWLWASDTTLSPTAQQRIGSMALSRAKNNPF